MGQGMTDRELMQQALDALEAMQSYAAAEKKGLRICDEAIEALRAQLTQAEQELVAWSRVNMNDHKEGDLGIGTVKWDASSPLVVHPHPAFQTIEALRARLAQPEPEELGEIVPADEEQIKRIAKLVEQEPVATLFGSLPVYDVPPKQEPVAWRTFDGEGGYEFRSYEMNENYAEEWAQRNPNHKGWVEPLYKDPTPCQTCESLARTVMMDQTSHDTAPPQREWMERERAVGYREGHQAALKQREWQGLTDEEANELTYASIAEIEAKLKEKNGF